jgi:NAD(P)-dependent dehydrogenase (short-subunit alcohol dehydrogenase family)
LVTGASGGIGRAIALALAAEGFDVALNDLTSSENLRRVVEEVSDLGAKAVAVPGDIAALDLHEAMLEKAEQSLGALTCLVNNAGVSVLARGDLLDVKPASYDRCQSVNARGTFFLTQAFARRLLSRRGEERHRSIITITSANAEAVSVQRGEYCMSKAAASMLSRLFAARLGGEGVGVYEIQPGFIDTAMTAPSKTKYDALIAQGLTVIPRFGTPEEVGRIAATLALGLLPYTCGQAIRADGGLMMVRY